MLILMATFNGLPHVKQQIASIQAQTYRDWRLLICDDGSSDGTAECVAEIALSDARISLHTESGQRCGSATQNFSRLLLAAAETVEELVLLCDQDDVWRHDKLAVIARCFSDLPDQQPTLVVSDLEVVDSLGRSQRGFFWERHRVPANEAHQLAELCTRNLYPGCSMALNRALLSRVIPLPQAIHQHDWWIALLASAAGRVIRCPDPLVAYRQHAANQVGATDLAQETQLFARHLGGKNRALFWHSFSLAKAAHARVSGLGQSPANLDILQTYAALPALALPKRIVAFLRMNPRRSSVRLSCALLYRMVFQIPFSGERNL